MQCFDISKVLDFNYDIEELLLISIDDQIETINDKDGIKVEGKVIVSGNVKTDEGNKDFSDKVDLDMFLTYEEIIDRNTFNVSVSDFNYKLDNKKLNLTLSFKIEGLKEIETTFLSQEDSEPFLEKIEEDDEKRVFLDEKIEVIDSEENKEIVEIKEEKKSLLKSVFSNKRIKEEVSWKLHCVKGEKTYEEIADKYKIDVGTLIAINKNESLVEGKLIFLPLK